MRGGARVRSGEIKCSFSNAVSFVARWSKSVLFQSFCSRQNSSLLKSFESEREILTMRLPPKEFWIKKISSEILFIESKDDDDDDDDDAVGDVRVTTWCNSAKRSTAAAPSFFFWKKKNNIFSSSKEAYLLFDWSSSDDGDDGDIIFVQDRRRGVERGGHR